MKKIVIAIVVIAILAVIIIIGMGALRANQQAQSISNYQTETVAQGNLTSLVGGTGTVRPNRTANLVWAIPGYVGTVNISAGTNVNADQLIASLDADNLPANVIAAQADLIAVQKQLDDLQNSSLATVQAAQTVSETQKSLIGVEDVYEKDFDTDKYQDELDNASEDVVDAKEKLDNAIDDLEPYLDRDPDNSTRKKYQDEVDDAQKEYDDAVRAYDLLVLDKAIAWQNVEILRAQLADAERAYDRVKDGPNSDDIAALQAQMDATQVTLDSVDITAPFAGMITNLDIKTGDPVNAGQIVARLDDLSKLLIDVPISEVDINRIEIGQEARLTFDAVQDNEFTGKVVEVSQVGISVQGVVEYQVTIEVIDATEEIRTGMTAAVNIVVDTLEDVLIVPNRAVRSMNGSYVVYVIENDELVMVPVVLGANSDAYSEVVDGKLRIGDRVVLNPPTSFDPTGGPPAFVRQR